MTFLLDTQVVSFFLQARRHQELAGAASRVPCAIVDEVRQELARDPTRGGLFEHWLPASQLAVLAIAIGSAADAWLNRLQVGVTGARGRGERASIAICATRDELVFTGMDKNAMWLALRELHAPGERLISLPVFLRRLVDTQALGGEAADDVMRHSRQTFPSWWANWLSAPRPVRIS
jgi:hypothetical protein